MVSIVEWMVMWSGECYGVEGDVEWRVLWSGGCCGGENDVK